MSYIVIKLKNGKAVSGQINEWRPKDGYLTLVGNEMKFFFSNIAFPKELLESARNQGWKG